VVDKVYGARMRCRCSTRGSARWRSPADLLRLRRLHDDCDRRVAGARISLIDNFRYPYASIGFSDFWRRWHISLSTWLRDYLYVPLGGNRKGPGRTYVNLLLTMLLGGLWHGAAWTYVVWGGLHGLFLVGERLMKQAWGEFALWKSWPGRLMLGVLTYALVNVTWVFFRAHDFPNAWRVLGAMLGLGEHGKPVLTTWLIVSAVVRSPRCSQSTPTCASATCTSRWRASRSRWSDSCWAPCCS